MEQYEMSHCTIPERNWCLSGGTAQAEADDKLRVWRSRSGKCTFNSDIEVEEVPRDYKLTKANP